MKKGAYSMSFSDITNSLGLTKSQAQKAEVLIKKADLDKSGTIEGSKETLELARLLAEQGGDLSAGTIKALKAQVIQNGGKVDILYNVFGDQSGVAQASANSTIHGIEDMLNLVNRNLGIDLTYEQLQTKEFPQPENFLPSKEKLTDNDRAVAYGEWKAAVVEWKEDIKDKLETLNEMNIRALSAQMAKGFTQTYINQGIEIDTIIQVYKELDGDMEKVKAKLDELKQGQQELKAGQKRLSGEIGEAKREIQEGIRGAELREMKRDLNRDFGLPPAAGGDEPDSTVPDDTSFNPEENFDGGGRRLEDMSSDEVKKILKGIAGLGEKAGDIARNNGYNPPPVGTDDFEAFLRGLPIEEIKNMFSPYTE